MDEGVMVVVIGRRVRRGGGGMDWMDGDMECSW